jgi:Ser/Thr protein kinase RdoA (MazF antagonist)
VVSKHLKSKKIDAPQIIPAINGDLVSRVSTGSWRLLKFIKGFSKKTVNSVEESAELGKCLGLFHLNIQDCKGIEKKLRRGRGAESQLKKLQAALNKFPSHKSLEEVKICANAVQKTQKHLPTIQLFPEHILHGDPKVSNFLFSEGGSVVKCMIDFDTVGWTELSWELADAFRSWCNPLSEDQLAGTFDLRIFEAALYSYVQTTENTFPIEEIIYSLSATGHIFLELAMRFLVDALEEEYFGWDSNNFDSASSHNLVRAKGQISACESLLANWSEANQVMSNL